MARGSLNPKKKEPSATAEASGDKEKKPDMKEIRKWIRKLEGIARGAYVAYVQKTKKPEDKPFTGKMITAEDYDKKEFNVENKTLSEELGAIMDSSEVEGLSGEKTKTLTLDFPRVSWNRAINRYILEKYVYALCLAEGKSTNDLGFIVDELTKLKISAKGKAAISAIQTKTRDEYSACINRKLEKARDKVTDKKIKNKIEMLRGLAVSMGNFTGWRKLWQGIAHMGATIAAALTIFGSSIGVPVANAATPVVYQARSESSVNYEFNLEEGQLEQLQSALSSYLGAYSSIQISDIRGYAVDEETNKATIYLGMKDTKTESPGILAIATGSTNIEDFIAEARDGVLKPEEITRYDSASSVFQTDAALGNACKEILWNSGKNVDGENLFLNTEVSKNKDGYTGSVDALGFTGDGKAINIPGFVVATSLSKIDKDAVKKIVTNAFDPSHKIIFSGEIDTNTNGEELEYVDVQDLAVTEDGSAVDMGRKKVYPSMNK